MASPDPRQYLFFLARATERLFPGRDYIMLWGIYDKLVIDRGHDRVVDLMRGGVPPYAEGMSVEEFLDSLDAFFPYQR